MKQGKEHPQLFRTDFSAQNILVWLFQQLQMVLLSTWVDPLFFLRLGRPSILFSQGWQTPKLFRILDFPLYIDIFIYIQLPPRSFSKYLLVCNVMYLSSDHLRGYRENNLFVSILYSKQNQERKRKFTPTKYQNILLPFCLLVFGFPNFLFEF